MPPVRAEALAAAAVDIRRKANEVAAALEAAVLLMTAAAIQAPETEIAQRAEEIHAEHHAGYIVPSLDSCPEHTRTEYEQLVHDLLRNPPEGTPDGT